MHSVVSYLLSKLIQHPVHSVIFKRFPSADKVVNTNEILLGKVLNVTEKFTVWLRSAATECVIGYSVVGSILLALYGAIICLN